VTNNVLTEGELELLIQFKIEWNQRKGIRRLEWNIIECRQRLKRLRAKLRRLAR
jgi:hypothetical protein